MLQLQVVHLLNQFKIVVINLQFSAVRKPSVRAIVDSLARRKETTVHEYELNRSPAAGKPGRKMEDSRQRRLTVNEANAG